MDRNINYTGQILYEKDILNTNKFGYVALSRIFDAIVGKNTVFNRLDCVPATVPNLTVDVETGEIYFAEETDTTPYGVLPVDTTIITKQGIFPEKTNFPTPAPIGAGNSINYLIEFKFETADTDIENRPYFNSASPSNPILQNAANFRSDKCLAQIITGVEAPTGTQVTPPVTAGWFGGWVITVNFGDTAVNSSAISKYPSAVFIEERLLDLAEVSPTPQKNLIIGGNFDTNPWQRETSVTGVTGSGYDYRTADRFAWGQTLGAAPMTAVIDNDKVASAPDVSDAGVFVQNSFRLKVATAQAVLPADFSFVLLYFMEGYEFAQIAQRPFTISFWVYATQAGKYSIGLANDATDTQYIAPYIIDAPNAWQKIEINVTPSPDNGGWDYENGRGLIINFTLAEGSDYFGTNFNSWETVAGRSNIPSDHVNFLDTANNEFIINLLKVEEEAIATPWKPRTVAEELALCQRYYEKSYLLAEPPGFPNPTDFITQTANGAYAHFQSHQFINRKRPASPGNGITAHVYSTVTGAIDNIRNATTNTDIPVIAFGQEQNLGWNIPAGQTAGDVIQASWTVDSELR